jgi:acyl carrier protein
MSMTEEQIKEDVHLIVADVLVIKPSEVSDESHLKDNLGADSLDMLDIAMDLEDEFDIDINDEEAHSLNTVGDIINCVKEKLCSTSQK